MNEMRIAVETAHSLGMKVAAHIYPAGRSRPPCAPAWTPSSTGRLPRAQTYELMKAHGTYLVPTLTVFEVFYVAARDHPELLTPGTAPKELANDLLPKQNFPNAVKSGVKIAYGTDIGEGDHAMEFGLMIAGGMTPADAVLAATRNAADLIGASDASDRSSPGATPTVATAGDPLRDPAQFEHVSFVMKGGVV